MFSLPETKNSPETQEMCYWPEGEYNQNTNAAMTSKDQQTYILYFVLGFTNTLIFMFI